jgi:hypothetical protein
MGSNVIFAIGAILIFGTFLSSSNRLMIGNTQIAEQNEYYISAVSLGQSVIDEAKTKAFDAKVIGVSVAIGRSGLTSTLGSEAGESFTLPDVLSSVSPYTSSAQGYLSAIRFNDLDDYNQYSRLVNTQRAEGFKIATTIYYVNELDPNTSSASQTYCKRMNVFVTSPFMTDTVKLSYTFTF